MCAVACLSFFFQDVVDHTLVEGSVVPCLFEQMGCGCPISTEAKHTDSLKYQHAHAACKQISSPMGGQSQAG